MIKMGRMRNGTIGNMSIEEFFKIEDKDLRKYAYLTNSINIKDEVLKVNNESKIAYYWVTKAIKVGNLGDFYVKSKLEQWISYDKGTKKVKVSKETGRILRVFLGDYFKYPELIMRIAKRPTPTMCKKIIEGKIKSIGDMVAYHRSYTVRKKDLSIETMYKFLIANELHLLHSLEDPENIDSPEHIKSLSIPSEVVHLKIFKFKTEEIPHLMRKYNEWISKQSKRYDSLQGPRASEDGNLPF